MESTLKKPEDYLAHYGVLGMKWGVRRSQSELDRLAGRTSSTKKLEEETPSKRHERLLKSTKASDLYKYRKELTNQEMQERLNRINMEKQLKTLSAAEKTTMTQRAEQVLKYGKLASDYYNLFNSPMGKAVRKTMEDSMKKKGSTT